jgi:hypothetical protein
MIPLLCAVLMLLPTLRKRLRRIVSVSSNNYYDHSFTHRESAYIRLYVSGFL